MCGTQTPQDLILTSATESSCNCCSSGSKAAKTVPRPGTAYSVEGLSCGSCVQRVESAVRAVAGVDSTSIDLVPRGTSTMTVSGTAAPEEIHSAVTAAGYSVTHS